MKPDTYHNNLLQAITACLTEDGHKAHIEGKGNTTNITITTKTGTHWTITTNNGQAHIHPPNIHILDNDPTLTHTIDLADPNIFTKITNHINTQQT